MLSYGLTGAWQLRAVRCRPDQRLPQRQPMDADIQKAADRMCPSIVMRDGEKRRSLRDRRPSALQLGRGRGLGRQRPELATPATPISPVSASSTYGVPDGSTRHAAQQPGGDKCSHDCGTASRPLRELGRQCAPAHRSDRARRAAPAAAAAFCRSQSLSSFCPICVHMARDACRSPPRVSMTAAYVFSHQGAPGRSAAALEPLRRASGSRAGSSNR